MFRGFQLETLTCPKVGWSEQKHNRVVTIAVDASMFPLIPAQSTISPEMCGKVQPACDLWACAGTPGERVTTVGSGKSAAANHRWGMLGLLFSSQSGKRDLRRNVATLWSLYLTWLHFLSVTCLQKSGRKLNCSVYDPTRNMRHIRLKKNTTQHSLSYNLSF